MKIMTVLGTRPEIIRLSRIISALDMHADEHVLVHTGQNYDERLSGIFFAELGVRQPDVVLGVKGAGFGDQIGQILARCEPLLREHRPDRLLILGDTNSGLVALVARRLGIPVYHMEAGNRCYDDRVPEEVNRRVIDHCSTVWMPYTERSRQNLLREGVPGQDVFVTGNPIREVILGNEDRIAASTVLDDLGLDVGRYFLVTMHRAENVDVPARLRSLVDALARLHEEHGVPVICSVHPRTRARIGEFGIATERAGLRFVEPLGFLDFVRLERSAYCLLSDSGTVQEEACLFGVPNVTIRDVTERPETVECGSNVLASCAVGDIVRATALVTARSPAWPQPPEYLVTNVTETVLRIVLGYRAADLAQRDWGTEGRV
jgi:UDP-N-acetylglucosamine 2-epimerase (non-hydrolysing)